MWPLNTFIRASLRGGHRIKRWYDQRKKLGSIEKTRHGEYSHSMMRFSVVPPHLGRCTKIIA